MRWLVCAGLLASPAFAQRADEAAGSALIQKYCLECHDTTEWAGGLALDTLDPAHVGTDAAAWEAVVRKLRTGMMPPPGKKRPPPAQLHQFTGWLTTRLDAAAPETAPVGQSSVRRLTRTEYRNAIRDLLALDVDVAALLPAENRSEGFDNIAAALASSPALVEGYVKAALTIGRLALGERDAPVTQANYRMPGGWSQDVHIEGLPYGTRGGLVVQHDFPVTGEYEFVLQNSSFEAFGVSRPNSGSGLYLQVDGRPLKLDEKKRVRAVVQSGVRPVAVAVVDRQRRQGVDDVFSGLPLFGGVTSVSITGPYQPQGLADTPSRRQVFICRPQSTDEELPCARRILARLASLAWRQPLRPDDAALEPLLRFYSEARQSRDFDGGIEVALNRLLIDPRFLFRVEPPGKASAAGTSRPLTGLELATRLSFFLWSSLPDERLLQLGADGSLAKPRVLEAEVRRMLADPRAEALVDNFASQWLHLDSLATVTPDVPGFDENLRHSMLRETKLLLGSVMREDRSVLRLLDADYTFLDERLARHYGIPGVLGSAMRRVSLAQHDERRGLLGQGAVLTLTSVAERTSPVVRGKWLLETLLAAPVPRPPPGVETNLDASVKVAAHDPVTLRQRMEQHRQQPACRSCHEILDPLGFALEHFDQAGRFRATDNGAPVDAAARLTDGTAIDGARDLRRWLLAEPTPFVGGLTEKLYGFALSRGVEARDMPAIRAIVRDARRSDYRFGDLVLGIVRSEAFQTFTPAPATTPAGAPALTTTAQR